MDECHFSVRVKEHFTSAGGGARTQSVEQIPREGQLGIAQRRIRTVSFSSRVHGLVWPEWWLDGYRWMSGSSFSRFHKTLHFSSRRSSSAECGTLSRMIIGSATNGSNITTKHNETRSPFLKADVRKILLVLSWRNVKIHSALWHALRSWSVVISVLKKSCGLWQRQKPAASMVRCGICLMDHCQHVTTKFYGSVNIKEAKTHKTTNHEAQQHVSLERPGVPQLVH